MPQMSPLLWTFMIIQSIVILLITSSFIYFYAIPLPKNLSHKLSPMTNPPLFYWLW